MQYNLCLEYSSCPPTVLISRCYWEHGLRCPVCAFVILWFNCHFPHSPLPGLGLPEGRCCYTCQREALTCAAGPQGSFRLTCASPSIWAENPQSRQAAADLQASAQYADTALRVRRCPRFRYPRGSRDVLLPLFLPSFRICGRCCGLLLSLPLINLNPLKSRRCVWFYFFIIWVTVLPD